MAYSIGLNENINLPEHLSIDQQAALRTWWTLYSMESELCLEYGRPLSIRETDAKASYPAEYPVSPLSTWNSSLAYLKAGSEAKFA
jgi:hypothetical protein